MNGFLNINKPSGISSNFVLTKLKKILPYKTKAGHLGTLDPLASGVLPVALGKATKLFNLLLNKTKTYIATFIFGFETDTLDVEGEEINRCEIIPTKEQINAVINNFIGKQQQMPPKYSAKNVNGNRAYYLARKGVDFELNTKEIEIFNFKLINQTDNKTFMFEIECSSGTYIRSIARDLAKTLNTFATMSELVRTKSGYFKIENAVEIEKVDLDKDLIEIGNVLNYEIININNQIDINSLKNGMKIKIESRNFENVCVYACQKLLGIGKIEQGYLKLKLHLYEES